MLWLEMLPYKHVKETVKNPHIIQYNVWQYNGDLFYIIIIITIIWIMGVI